MAFGRQEAIPLPAKGETVSWLDIMNGALVVLRYVLILLVLIVLTACFGASASQFIYVDF